MPTQRDNNMQEWLDRRSRELLKAINAVPFADDHDLKKLRLIREALQEAAGELWARAAQRTRAELARQAALRRAESEPEPAEDKAGAVRDSDIGDINLDDELTPTLFRDS